MAEHCNVCLSRLMTHLEQTWQNIAMCVCLDSSGADVAEHCNVCLSRLMTHLEQTWQNIAMCVCLDS